MRYILVILFIWELGVLQAQQPARTFYFMDNAPIRLVLNPAMQPQKGYFSFPFLGAIGVSAVSNSLGIKDFADILDEENAFLDDEKFMDKLKERNSIHADLLIDLISFGFYSGKGFWTFDIGAKLMINTSIPRSMFEFARNSDQIENVLFQGKQNYDIRDVRLHLNTFGQIGLGYSRPVCDWLTVGAKVKFLVGLANLDLDIDRMSISSVGNQWLVETKGQMDASVKGLELEESSRGYINNVDFDSPGIGGYGAGFDLGIAAKVWKELSISAAITDLGFIKWSKSSYVSAVSDDWHTFSTENTEKCNVLDYNLIQLQKKGQKNSRRTSLYPTLNLGAEYSFCRNQVSVGLLSSTTFYKPDAYSELTLSANYHPGSWFGATISYSFLHSDFKTFGLGIRLGPVFLATDYMLTGGLDSINRANAYLGINFPIGSKGNKKIKKNREDKLKAQIL